MAKRPPMTPLELLALPILPGPHMVDAQGKPSKEVHRVAVDGGGFALVCHPDQVEALKAGLKRDVAKLGKPS